MLSESVNQLMYELAYKPIMYRWILTMKIWVSALYAGYDTDPYFNSQSQYDIDQ